MTLFYCVALADGEAITSKGEYLVSISPFHSFNPASYPFISSCDYFFSTPSEYLDYFDCFHKGECPSSGSEEVGSGEVGSGNSDFDYSHASEIFGFFFIFTVSLWAFSKAIGLVIKAVKEF
jgi:hypothetical protein